MADSGAVLKFPGGRDPKAAKGCLPKPVKLTKECPLPPSCDGPPPAPTIDSYDYDETLALYQIATSIKKKAEDLILFVDKNRQTARQAGMEMLVVQIESILEGDKFQRVVDALEDAIYRRTPICLTRDGADKVHRLERLISEADSSVLQFMGGRRSELGQNTQSFAPYPVYPERASSDVSTWIPVVIIGIAGIVGVIAIIALTRPPHIPQEPVLVRPSRKS